MTDKELSRQKRVMNFHLISQPVALLIGLVIAIPIYILVVSVCVILGY